MKNTKILLILLLALCMVMAVTAGASGDSDGSASPEPTSSATAEAEPTATPEITEEPTATPEATAEPTATPEATAEPTATPEPTPVPENITLSVDKTDVFPGQTVTVSIHARLIDGVIRSGSVGLGTPDNPALTAISITGADGITWEEDADIPGKYDFTVTTPSALADIVLGTFSYTVPVDATEGTLNLMKITDVATLCSDYTYYDASFSEDFVSINVKANGGKIILNDEIKSTDGFSVVYQSEGNEDIAAILTLKEDGKTIAVSTDATLTDGVTYTAVATCGGYISDSATFTVTDGYYSFEIKGMLPGDMDGDNDIDFFDFNNLCTKVADGYEVEDYPEFDLNKDGEIDRTDILALVNSWKDGGAE